MLAGTLQVRDLGVHSQRKITSMSFENRINPPSIDEILDMISVAERQLQSASTLEDLKPVLAALLAAQRYAHSDVVDIGM